MCGITGLYNYSDRQVDSKSIIKKIINIQHNRGPDDNGMWESQCKKIFFGHNRLSVIDLSPNGKQPFISSDDNFVITFNGEIYNFLELKNELLKKNITFKSNSDTEVLIESYKYWGLDFLKKLRGMFAFAIWDSAQKKIILARDPFGIKPLYYTIQKDVFYFASEIKSLLSIPNLHFHKSEAAIVSYYLWGNVQEPLTLYNEISSIKKGTCKIINNNGTEENFEYANIKNAILEAEPKNFINEKNSTEYLKSIIDETVEYHQVSDIPITFLLSAGIDSNVLIASIHKKNKKNCSALTLDFDYSEKKIESRLAKKTANMNEINHKIENINSNELVKLIQKFYINMDSPTNDALNNFAVSHFAKQLNSKVIISGIGADEFFGGYPSFNRIPKLNNLFKLIPKSEFFNNLFKNNIQKILKSLKLNTKYSGIYEYSRDVDTAFLLQRSLFLPNEIKEMLSPDVFKRGFEELDIMQNLKDDIKDIKEKKLAIMYLEIKYYLCSKILRDSDWASMSNSVEMRTPFVDWFFFKKLLPLLKSNIKIDKKSLLKCYNHKLPRELVNRKKTGFVIPHTQYLKELSSNKINFSNPIKDWSIFNYQKYLNNEK